MPVAGNLPLNPVPAEWYFWGLLEFRSRLRPGPNGPGAPGRTPLLTFNYDVPIRRTHFSAEAGSCSARSFYPCSEAELRAGGTKTHEGWEGKGPTVLWRSLRKCLRRQHQDHNRRYRENQKNALHCSPPFPITSSMVDSHKVVNGLPPKEVPPLASILRIADNEYSRQLGKSMKA